MPMMPDTGVEGEAAGIKEVSVRDDHILVEGGGPCGQTQSYCLAAGTTPPKTVLTCARCGKPVSTVSAVLDFVAERTGLARPQPEHPGWKQSTIHC